MKCTLVVVLFLTLISLATSAIRPVAGSLDLDGQFERSDVVIVGTIDEVNDVGGDSVEVSQRQAVVRVERAYKGNVPRTVPVLFKNYNNPTETQYRLVAGQRTLLFLKAAPGDSFNFEDEFSSLYYPSSTIAEIGNDRSGFGQLQADLLAGLSDTNIQRVLTNLELLQGFRRLSTAEAVIPLLRKDDPNVVVRSYAVLMKNKNFKFNNEMVSFLEHLPPNDQVSLMELANVIDALATDNVQLSTLVKLTSSRHLPIRNAAMNALRKIRSPQTISALIARLDDADPFITFTAIKTLSEITGLNQSSYSPDLPNYLQNPSRYRDVWKQWATQNNTKY